MAEYYSIAYMYDSFHLHSSVDGHLCCFRVPAVMNSAAVRFGVHVCFLIMIFSGYMPSSGITNSYGHSWQPALLFGPGEPRGRRSQAIYSPWGCKELDLTERLTVEYGRRMPGLTDLHSVVHSSCISVHSR